MKTLYLGEVNGFLPLRTTGHQTGWVVGSRYESGATMTEAEGLKLLGEALEHQEQLARAIVNLRVLLGVKS